MIVEDYFPFNFLYLLSPRYRPLLLTGVFILLAATVLNLTLT